jgi:hypothetical protein
LFNNIKVQYNNTSVGISVQKNADTPNNLEMHVNDPLETTDEVLPNRDELSQQASHVDVPTNVEVPEDNLSIVIESLNNVYVDKLENMASGVVLPSVNPEPVIETNSTIYPVYLDEIEQIPQSSYWHKIVVDEPVAEPEPVAVVEPEPVEMVFIDECLPVESSNTLQVPSPNTDKKHRLKSSKDSKKSSSRKKTKPTE